MRTTITFSDKLYRRLKIRAAETGTSISSLVEDAVKYQILEDEADIKAVAEREGEESIPFDKLLEELELDSELWETVVDFTIINKKGVPAKDVLKALE